MGKVGYWTYWYKSPDGFDISFCTNKKNIPKGYTYITSMKVYKPDGNTDEEIISNNKVIWRKKNSNKLSKCDMLKLSFEVQEKLHEFLNVPFPTKGYEKVFKKKIQTIPELKRCKLK